MSNLPVLLGVLAIVVAVAAPVIVKIIKTKSPKVIPEKRENQPSQASQTSQQVKESQTAQAAPNGQNSQDQTGPNVSSKQSGGRDNVLSKPASFDGNRDDQLAREAQKYIDQAKSKAREIIIEAKDEAIKIKSRAENEIAKARQDVTLLEQKVADKLTKLEEKEKELEQKSQDVEKAKELVEREKEKLQSLISSMEEKLQNISGLTKEEAKSQLLGLFEKELVQEKAKRIKEIEEEIKLESERLSQDILLTAMRRGATDLVAEHTVSRIKLPDEDMKGRIIGREGRNIRTLEELTGVDLDMDSSPGDVIISSFDPVRREIARIALEKLMADGRIQPARIEEIVLATQKDMDQILYKEGENLCHRVGVYNLPRDVVSVLGRFKYRFSYGQNLIEHTLEETRIGVSIAQEIGADVEVVRMACLLHDIGKVITDEEGSHVDIGVDFLKRYKLPEKVIACVAEHHGDKPFTSVESVIVNLADHVSGTRPGARSEDYESFKKRMEDLEKAATSFDGVEKAYAISAGREVRVIVKPEKVDDATAKVLAREIAKKIELEQNYPGVVKVVVIREVRFTDTAK